MVIRVKVFDLAEVVQRAWTKKSVSVRGQNKVAVMHKDPISRQKNSMLPRPARVAQNASANVSWHPRKLPVWQATKNAQRQKTHQRKQVKARARAAGGAKPPERANVMAKSSGGENNRRLAAKRAQDAAVSRFTSNS